MAELVSVTALVVGTAVVIVSSLLWLLRQLNEWRFARVGLPPGSMGWPVIGEMIDFLWCFKFMKSPDDFIAKRKARYGDTGIYKTHLFGHPAIVTCCPEINKQILASTNDDGNFNTGWLSNELLGTSALGVVDGLLHKRLRRHIFGSVSSPKSLVFHLSTAQPFIMSVLEDWVTKKRINAYKENRVMTFRNICDILVSFKSEELLEKMETLYAGLMAGIRSMSINIPGTTFHHALKCREQLNAILFNEMRQRKSQSIPKQDLMQILMDSVDEDGSKLTEEEIVDNIVSSILGGFESTANVMTWGLYYLAKYPEILEKLKDETRLIRQQKSKYELLTSEDIKKFKYTSNVAEELIRLANVSPFIFRRAVKDNVVINGYKIPKDWKILVWIRTIHLDAKYYPDPTEFKPDRWNEMMPNIGTFSAFGAGRRLCPGNNFARLQVMLFLHHICLGYRWELLNPDAGVTYQPNPLSRVLHRKSNCCLLLLCSIMLRCAAIYIRLTL